MAATRRTVASLWLVTVGIVELGVRFGPFAALAVFIVMGPMHARFAILMHESAHKLLFTNKRANDFVGKWFIAYPAMVPISIYRRSHFAHHKEEFGPEEPDMAFYSGYPCGPARPAPATRARRRRHLGLQELQGAPGTTTRTAQGRADRLVDPGRAGRAVRAVLGGTGAWWSYLLFWWLQLDDPVARAEPAARDRRTRRDGRRATTGVSPRTTCASTGWRGSGSSPTTPDGTWRTTSTWACRGTTCPAYHRELQSRRLRDRRDHLPELPRAVARGVLGAGGPRRARALLICRTSSRRDAA